MNDDFHNNSSHLGIFLDIYMRKVQLLTKCVCGRIETFSMSAHAVVILTKSKINFDLRLEFKKNLYNNIRQGET